MAAADPEAEPSVAIKSRWLLDDDEDLPTANGQVRSLLLSSSSYT